MTCKMCSRANPTALSLSAISNADAKRAGEARTGNGLEKAIAVAVCCFIDKTKSFARLRVESRCMLSKSMENVKIKNNISLCFLHREPFRQVVGCCWYDKAFTIASRPRRNTMENFAKTTTTPRNFMSAIRKLYAII